MAKRAQMTVAPTALTKMKAVKTKAVEPQIPTDGDEKRRGQTLRLRVEAWKQLKILAVNEQKTAHDLLLEAVNMLFRDRGQQPMA